VARIDAHNPPVPAELAEALAASRWEGFSGSAVGVRRIHARPESLVAELLVSDGRRAQDVVFKIQKARPGPASKRARCEHDALSLLSGLFARAGGHGVPRPLHFDEARATIVMERCVGMPLDGLIRAARGRRDPGTRTAIASAARRAGEWLRQLQEYTGRAGDAEAALEELVAGARRDLEICVRRGLSPRRAARMVERLTASVARARPVRPWLVGHHGDFWPGNIYVDDDTVQVIDFEGFREGLPYEDPSYFLAQLQLFYAYPFMGSEYGALAATFREGYLEGGEFDETAAEVCRVAKALQILARSEGGASPAGLRGWWRRRTLYAGALGRRA